MQSQSTHLPVGTRLKGQAATYTIVKVLGQGSFGITYLARTIAQSSDELEQYVCLKEFFMREVNGRDDTKVTSSREGMFGYYKRKFEQESEHLCQLRHQHIVKVTDAFHANNTVYYAMQYIEGMSLDSLIASKRRLPLRQAVDIVRQIASALAFMHGKGMLHLDVKPANVMMASEDNAILIDFGLSKQYDANGQPESSTKVGAGTPGYAPLEQASFREGKDFPVTMDVYALGATLYKMLTGVRPPEASDILNEGFPYAELSAAGIPKAVIAVVEKAMAPQRMHRYANMADFVRALDKATASAASQPSSRKPAPQGPRPADERTHVIQPDPQPSAFDSPALWKQIGGWIAGVGILMTIINPCVTGMASSRLYEDFSDGYTGVNIAEYNVVMLIFAAAAAALVYWKVRPACWLKEQKRKYSIIAAVAAVGISTAVGGTGIPAEFQVPFQLFLSIVATGVMMKEV